MRYIIPNSFATFKTVKTPDGCKKEGAVYTYPYSGQPHVISSTSCAAAKNLYLKNQGLSTSQQSADRSNLNPPPNKHKPQDIVTKGENSTDVKPSPVSNSDGGGKCPQGVNPASGCCNCQNDWWNPLQWGCVLFTKPGCELQVAWKQGTDGITKWFGDNALLVAGGGILVIIIASMILKRM